MARTWPEDPAADPRSRALARAHHHAAGWLSSLGERRVLPSADADEVVERLGRALPEGPSDPAAVIDLLAEAAEPGLTAMPSGRFYGMVIGGTAPAALAADWLVSAWDQNTGFRFLAPAASAIEEVAAAWLVDLLGLPPESGVGFPTGATTANLTCLLAARDRVLAGVGWDAARDGLSGSPPVRVITGAEGHESVRYALRYAGLGTPDTVDVDAQGRLDVGALRVALRPGGPCIVVLQAGNVHSGAFDPFPPAIAAAREAGAWVHVDGAFGLFAAASPRLRELTDGLDAADSWTTDAHKTLNVPYDCGIAIVRDPSALHAVTGKTGAYLVLGDVGEPFDRVPELSRRARGIPVWALLRSLGRSGVADLVERFCRHATAIAEGIRALPGAEILNDVEFTQVCVSFGTDARTEAIVRTVLADGTAWLSGSRWRGRAVLRVSVCNWATGEDDVRRTLEALSRAVDTVDGR